MLKIYYKGKRVRLVWAAIVTVIILAVVFLGAAATKQEPQKYYVQTETTVNLTHNNSFSKDSIIALIKKMPFSYRDVLYGQCLYESAHFSSPIFKENNNCLGIRHPLSRKTMSLGSRNGYSVYESYKTCLLDRVIYDAVYMHGLSRREYMAYLDKVYARSGGNKYSQEIEKIIKQNNIKQLFK